MSILTRRLFNEIQLYDSEEYELINPYSRTDKNDGSQAHNDYIVRRAINKITDNKIKKEFEEIINSNNSYGIGVIKPSSILGECLRNTQTSKLAMLDYNYEGLYENTDYSFYGDNHNLLFFIYPHDTQLVKSDNLLTPKEIYNITRDEKDLLLEKYLLGIPVEEFLNSITDETIVNVDVMNTVLSHEPLV